jgi:transcriptional regulator with XRE-family HTH domain
VDDRRVGRVLRVLRRRKGWRQVDLAEAARASQWAISEIERGRWSRMPVETLRRVFGALDADFDCAVRFRGAEIDRLLDERHAATAGAVATMLRRRGWTVAAEVSFNHYGDRGAVDLLAVHPAGRIALVVEVKSEITSAEETLRRLDVKYRLGSGLARERFGERPARVVRLLAVSESTANRDRVARLDALFGPAFRLRGVALRHWLAAPAPTTAGGLLFVRNVRPIGAGNGMGGARRVRRPRRGEGATT